MARPAAERSDAEILLDETLPVPPPASGFEPLPGAPKRLSRGKPL
ncbi:hypothetical protein FHS29_002512 [Saccharothrix tamanrassetensis]|uniref:Uncharacterized protein n=1 Tax=Saccharothrix tamanrassetensis TaxID=1051531 RepID=A0A841CF49_9PSEU|nr:hypothetical protein [Saccharothrix tamanrassetensis]MBB5955931.1 hypothetical protein [Saccharothrix tamanrassetensis]